MKNITLITLGLGWFLTSTSFGNVFTYKLKGYPKQDPSCYNQSKMVANDFANKTGVKVDHIECTKENESSYDFVIEYESSSELKFTTTDYKRLSVYKAGRYKDSKTCNDQLANQTAIFEQATRLKPIFSYCRDEEYTFKPWSIIITAVGESELQPLLGGYLFFSTPKNITYTQLYNGLRESMEKQGAILSDLVFQGNAIAVEATIHYYAKERLDFSLEEVTNTGKLEICQVQAEEAKTWFKSFSQPPFTIYCGAGSFGQFELSVGFIGKALYMTKNSTESFNTFEECESNKKEVISHYEGSSMSTVLGGLCSKNPETPKYNVVIVTTPKN